MDSGIIKETVNSLLVSLFPLINCQEPYIIETNLYIPFYWNGLPGREALMVFNDFYSFDPFKSKPLADEYSSEIDWIRLKYLTKEPAIFQLEEFLFQWAKSKAQTI